MLSKENTLCYFLCVPDALKKGYVPHVFVEVAADLTVSRVFARTNRVRKNGFRLLKVGFEGDRPVVHVTKNTLEATAVRGITVNKLGEPDGLSWSTSVFECENLTRVAVPGSDEFKSSDHGFISYKGSWENGPFFNLKDYLTLNEAEPESTEPETTVATWEIAYLVLLSIVYLFMVGIIIGLAFYYLKKAN